MTAGSALAERPETAGADSTPEGPATRRWSLEHVAVGAVVSAFAVAVASSIWIRSPLGHDESVYALRARDLIEGGWTTSSGVYWADYRAPGLSIMLAAVGRIIGLHVSTSRAVVMVLGAVIVATTWFVARRVGGPVAGLVAAVTLAASAGFVLTSSLLLADVPGAAFTMVAVAVYTSEIRDDRLRWSWWVVPLCALAATVSRFGAPIMLGAGLVGVTIMFAPRLLGRRDWLLIAQIAVLGVATALTCALVMFTHLVSLGDASPVEANQNLVGGKGLTFATGWRDLRRVVNPWSDYSLHLWSGPVAVLVALGVALALVGVAVRRVPAAVVAGAALAAVVSTFGIVLTVGLVVPNYLALSLPFWAILAGLGYGWTVAAIRSWSAPLVAGLAVVGAVIAAFLVVDAARDARAAHGGYIDSFGAIRSSSVQVNETYEDGRCLLVTSYSPQVGYYSGCDVVTFSGSELEGPLQDELIPRIVGRTDAPDGYDVVGVFVVESGKRQPPDEVFDSAPSLDRRRLFEHGEPGARRRHSWVQLIEPCAWERTC